MNKRKMENLKTAAIIVLLFIVVFGGSYFASELKGCRSGEGNTTQEEVAFDEIDIDEYLALKDGASKSIIYIARPGCYYCQQQEPIMKEMVSSYGITVHYLNTDNLGKDGLEKLKNSDEYFSGEWGTPTTLIVQGGKIVDMAAGLATEDGLMNLFKEHGFIS